MLIMLIFLVLVLVMVVGLLIGLLWEWLCEVDICVEVKVCGKELVWFECELGDLCCSYVGLCDDVLVILDDFVVCFVVGLNLFVMC